MGDSWVSKVCNIDIVFFEVDITVMWVDDLRLDNWMQPGSNKQSTKVIRSKVPFFAAICWCLN